MGQVVHTDFVTRFPNITFRKKRLSIVIHGQFDLECETDVQAVREMIEKSMAEITKEGAAKITYTVTDI